MFADRVPTLRNPNIQIRLTKTARERQAADQLIFHNYVAEGFWKPDASLSKNKNLSSPFRTPFVVLDGDAVIGTASLIVDSANGLPSDEFQPRLLNELRDTGDTLGEISCLAIDKAYSTRGWLIFFLIKYYLQYSFYYAGIDRLVKACKPEHAEFYANVLKFDRVGPITYCEYASRPSQLLSMNLLQGHHLLNQCYGKADPADPNFYRFLLVDEHPSLVFPAVKPRRPRGTDWPTLYARNLNSTPNDADRIATIRRWEVAHRDPRDSALI